MKSGHKKKISDIMKCELNNENLYQDLTLSNTHAESEHTRKSDEDLAERLLQKLKIPGLITFSVSTFMQPTAAEKHIMKVIKANKNIIATWLQDPQRDSVCKISLKTGTIDKPCGYGLKNTGTALLYYETPVTQVILKYNKQAPRRCYIVTAFPDIDIRSAVKLNKDPLNIISKTEVWQTESELFKFYITCLSKQTTNGILLHCPSTPIPHLDFIDQIDSTHQAVIQYYPLENKCTFIYESKIPDYINPNQYRTRLQIPPPLTHLPYQPTDQRCYNIDTDDHRELLKTKYNNLFTVLEEKRKEFNQTERIQSMATMNDDIRRGEIYYIFKDTFNHVVGSEQDAGRPAVIVSNDMNNKYSKIVDVVFLTTQDKKPLPTHVDIETSKKASTVLCEQIHPIDKHRIGNKYGTVTQEEMHKIDEALCISLGINVSINGNNLLKAWCEAYDKKGNDIQLPKPKPEPVVKPAETKTESTETNDTNVKHTPEYIRVEAERDIYKQLYLDLLNKSNNN